MVLNGIKNGKKWYFDRFLNTKINVSLDVFRIDILTNYKCFPEPVMKRFKKIFVKRF